MAEAGDFSAAARRTGERQPAVSKAIAALEERLGVALFHRSTRSVTLTDHGRRYLKRTKLMVEEIDDADNEMTSSSLRVSGSVRISVASTFGRLHILPLILKLLTLYPELEVDLILSDVVRDMVEDRVDLTIRIGPADEPRCGRPSRDGRASGVRRLPPLFPGPRYPANACRPRRPQLPDLRRLS